MAINYINISQMDNITTLSRDDKILVARADGNTTGYTTYSSTLGALSSSISCDISDAAKGDFLITTIEGMSEAGANAKAINGTVGLQIYNIGQDIRQHFVNKDLTSTTTIAGDITFSNAASPKVETVACDSSHTKNTVNVGMLQNYVSSQITTTANKSIGNSAPTTYVYQVVTKNASTNDVYENQSYNLISLLKSNFQNGPIVHKCTQNCTVIITTYSAGSSFTLFGLEDNGEVTNKAFIKSNQSSRSWHILGRQTASNGLMTVSVKAGTWLCFYMNIVWDSVNRKYIPSYTSDYNSGDIIVIDEYR